jgi:hypothetical protein
MINSIFDKTDKGREEIASRTHHLAPRLRTLLVLVDGKQSGEELLKKVGGIGLTEESIAELLGAGFIREAVAVKAEIASLSPSPSASPLPTAESAPPAETILPEGESQFVAIYHFYTETIKSVIGLRGYGLQLKVEKASSVEDFRALREPYLAAVHKAKGGEMERSLRIRLDQLLYLGESAAPNTTPANLASQAE